MMSYIIESAERSRLFDTIHVSTENDEIAGVAETLGHPVHFLRPPELADDHTPIMPVLRMVVKRFQELGKMFDEVWLLMACAPLVDVEDLKAAARLFESHQRKIPVLAVAPYPAPIEWAFTLVEDGSLVPVQPGKFAYRSQDLGVKYYDAGVFSVFPVNHVVSSEGAGDDQGFKGLILDREKAIDIDNEEDWIFAERMYAAINPVK